MLRRLHNHIYACKLKEVFEGPLVLVYQTLGNVDQLSLKQQVRAALSKEPTVKDATFSVCHMKNAVAAATGDDTLSKLFTNSNLLLGFKLPTQQQHPAVLPPLEQQQQQQQQDRIPTHYQDGLAAAMQRAIQRVKHPEVLPALEQQQQQQQQDRSPTHHQDLLAAAMQRAMQRVKHPEVLPPLEQQQQQQQQDRSPTHYQDGLAAAMQQAIQRVKQDMSPQQVVGGHLEQQQPGPHIPQPALKAFVEAGMQLPSEQPLVLIGAFYKCAATPMGRLKKWIKLDQGQVYGELLSVLDTPVMELLAIEAPAEDLLACFDEAAGEDLTQLLEYKAAVTTEPTQV